MSHKFLIPFVTVATLVAPTMLPSALVSALAPGLSAVAEEAINLNSSRSNNTRTTKSGSPVTTPKAPGGAERMGSGGGTSTKNK
jgi:hypothetical protein